MSVTDRATQNNIVSSPKASCLKFLCTDAEIRSITRLKFTRSDTLQRLRLCQPFSRGYSLVEKSFHSLAVAFVGRHAGPCVNIPFQSEGERDHPSAGLLRIFMTGWCTAVALWQGSYREVRDRKYNSNGP